MRSPVQDADTGVGQRQEVRRQLGPGDARELDDLREGQGGVVVEEQENQHLDRRQPEGEGALVLGKAHLD